MNEIILDLHKKRKDWLEKTKENKFDFNELLTELYPDNAHFIYELLQNAEDTGATIVNFELLEDKLIFSHNGRNFNEKDLEGVTSIGQGTKKDDVNKIGKFGVGFKAVFSYTSTPIIHSGEYHFKIDDLVVPTEIEKIETIDNTTMIFLFNNPNKSKRKAFLEIKQGLVNIKENTLLFLNNIKKIEYSYLNFSNYIERIEIDNIKTSIFNKNSGYYSKFIRFKKFLPNNDNLFVSIAFKIGRENGITKVIPIKKGKVFIFFPAEKETSNLKFHLHAPFVSTVARDSIKDLDDNIKLINLITDLLLEILEYVKNNNFLTFDFIKCLPIEDDNLSTFYQPIMNKFIDLFNNYPFIPVENNDYQPAKKCYRGNKILKELFDIELLRKIEQKDDIYWIKNPNQNNNREDKFLQLLEIHKFSIEELYNKLFPNFIESNSDEWFNKFYTYLYEQKHTFVFNDESNKIKWKTFIKLNNNSLNINGRNCYFSDVSSDDILIVKKEVYKQEKSKKFLEFLGVKEINEKERMKIVLSQQKYISGKSIDDIQLHLKELEMFLNYFNETKDISIFEDKYLILDKANILRQPSTILIDNPYILTYMNTLKRIGYFRDKKAYIISDIYLDIFNQNKQLFLDFFNNLNIINSLKIIKLNSITINNPSYFDLKLSHNSKKRNDTKIEEDYTIFNFEFLLSYISNNKTEELSLLIWNLMKNAEETVFYAKYRPNKSSELKQEYSILIHLLQKNNWIPSKNGNFYKPADISKEILSDKFIYDNKNGWLNTIEFEKNIHKKKKEYQELDKKLQDKIGIHLEILEELKNQGLTEEDLKKFIKLKQQQTLQESLKQNEGTGETKEFIQAKNNETIIIDEEKYQKQVQEDNKNNKNEFQESKTKYKKQDIKELNKIEQFLYEEYEGHCQICGDTFAYNNKNTFKIKSLNIGKNRDINRKGNSICLCHKHHEIFKLKLQKNLFQKNLSKVLNLTIIEDRFNKYDFVGKEDINTYHDSFYNLSEDDEFKKDEIYFLPIKLFNKIEYIKFTKAHILEFIDVWNNY